MSAGPANPVDRLEQAATQFKNSVCFSKLASAL